MTATALPVDSIFEDLNLALKTRQRIVLQAEPGAGKSTRLPLLLLKQGNTSQGQFSPRNQIVMLEPRRVAARQIASFLASQLNEKVGETVGIAMRGEQKRSNKTVITIVTDGVLVKMLQADPELTNVGLVIFDEFHERALQSDLALALSLDAQQINEQLKLLIMSATLDAEQLADDLDASVIKASGRKYPVTMNYVASELKPSIADITKAVTLAWSEHASSILVFLSGIREITQLQEALKSKVDNNTDILPLYGSLSLEQQVNAIQPSKAGRRKIVLATNIAQTSLTIEDIDVVVDAGYEKSMQFMPRLKTNLLVTQPISKASAEQRAGRAGRLRPGYCYQLGNPDVLTRRRPFDEPEISRTDLAELLLEVQAWGAELADLYWPTSPPPALVSAAQDKLAALGFWQRKNDGWQATELANKVSRYGADLRIVRLLHFAELHLTQPQELAAAALLAAFLSDSNVRLPMHLLDLIEHSNRYVTPSIKQRARKFAQQLGIPEQTRPHATETLSAVVALAFPDRIAKKSSKRWKMSNGTAVEFHHQSSPSRSDLIAVVDVSASEYGQYIQSYVDVDLAELESIAPDFVKQETVVSWSESKQGPKAERQTLIGELALERQTIQLKLDDEQWQNVWLSHVLTKGLGVFEKFEPSGKAWLNRVSLAVHHDALRSAPDWLSGLSSSRDIELKLLNDLAVWLGPYLTNVRSMKALQKLDLLEMLNAYLGWDASQSLKQCCPTKFKTPANTNVTVDYLSETPKISVRMQEMFGEPLSPAICNGRQPLLIELLSPARRPLQVTQDLANFWQNAYQEVKKEMRGRYPKHHWPDHPETEQAGHSLKSRR